MSRLLLGAVVSARAWGCWVVGVLPGVGVVPLCVLVVALLAGSWLASSVLAPGPFALGASGSLLAALAWLVVVERVQLSTSNCDCRLAPVQPHSLNQNLFTTTPPTQVVTNPIYRLSAVAHAPSCERKLVDLTTTKFQHTYSKTPTSKSYN